MQIVIDIPEDIYEQAINGTEFDTLSLGIKLKQSVQKGFAIPKGHGGLIDADELLKHKHTISTSNYCEYNVVYVETIKEAPIIIEVDKAESEE